MSRTGAQQVFLVVHPGGWDAAGQDELPAVRIGVAGEPVYGVAGHRGGGAVGQALQRAVEGPDTAIGQQVIGVLEADEGHGRLTVLADGLPLDGRPLLGRDERCQVRVRPWRRHAGGRRRGRAPQEMPALHALAEHAAGQPLRRRLAHVDLPGVGSRLPVERDADVRTRDQQLTVGSEWEVEGEGSGVHSDGDPESHGTVVAPAYGLGNDPSHAVARPARMDGVVLSPEEDQEGVATEFDDVAAFGQADVDHVVEAGVQEIGELLGAAPAHCGQLLGQPGEAGDVRRNERPVDQARRLVGRLSQPLGTEPRDVRSQ